MDACDDAIEYPQGDELPPWQGIVKDNGEYPDFSSGWTFTVTISRKNQATTTITTGIVGQAGGVFTVNWPKGTMARAVGDWLAQITYRRVADGFEGSKSQVLRITPRVLAEV